jgi:hypothetical protein
MLKAKVFSTEITEDYNEKLQRTFYRQEAAIFTGAEYPLIVKISHPSRDRAHPVGEYTVHPSCFRVGRFGGLEIDNFNFRLVAEKGNVKAHAA